MSRHWLVVVSQTPPCEPAATNGSTQESSSNSPPKHSSAITTSSGLDLTNVCIDGSDHLAPCGGKGAGHGIKHPGRLSWKWCMAVDGDGIPIAWVIDAGNRNDYAMFFPVLDQLARPRLDPTTSARCTPTAGSTTPPHPTKSPPTASTHFIAPTRKQPGQGTVALVGMGQRWIVEATNSWLRAYGQLRRNTDRKPEQRHAALCFAIALFITHRLLDPKTSPIR